MKRIQIIEDDAAIRAELKTLLQANGYATVEEGSCDLVLMDVNLPGESGFTLCRKLRQSSSTPVIFLTALGQVGDRTQGLNSGADDYIVKPFAFEELLARIRCVLRRPVSLQNDELLSFGDIAYEPRTLTLRRGEQSTVLSKRLGDLLELFLRNPGQTLPRETILLRVWGMDCDVEDGNLDNYTYFLRRSLRKVGSCLQLATVRGVGYRLEERHG